MGALSEQVGEAGAPMQKVVVSVHGMTQQNSALVEEASAAALELHHQAGALAGVAGIFRLAGASHQAPRPVALLALASQP